MLSLSSCHNFKEGPFLICKKPRGNQSTAVIWVFRQNWFYREKCSTQIMTFVALWQKINVHQKLQPLTQSHIFLVLNCWMKLNVIYWHWLIVWCSTTVCGLLIFGQGLVFAFCCGFNCHIQMWNYFLWSAHHRTVSAQRNSHCQRRPFQFQSSQKNSQNVSKDLHSAKNENCHHVQYLPSCPSKWIWVSSKNALVSSVHIIKGDWVCHAQNNKKAPESIMKSCFI